MTVLGNTRCCCLYVLFWIGLLLGACTPDSPTPTPVAAVPVSTARWTATEQSLPTATVTPLWPTATPAVTDTDFPTLTPTLSPLFGESGEFDMTPLPSPLPSRTATAIPTHYDLPSWVSDPEAAVLAALTYNDSHDYDELISIINASVGESTTFPQPRFTSDLSWLETEEGVALQIYRWEGSGNVFNIPYRDSISAATGNLTSERLEVLWGDEPESPDGAHIAYVLEDEATKTVHIKNVQTNQIVDLVDPFAGRYADGYELSWSPTSDLLMVLQYDFGEEMNDPTAYSLVIYAANGDIFRSYDDFYFAEWLPDNSYRLLYEAADDSGDNRPCILNIRTNSVYCIEEVAAWSNELNVETGWYQWAPASSQISFVYWNYSSGLAGLCVTSLESQEITCPIESELLLTASLGPPPYNNVFIMGYEWSPDSRFLWLRIDPFGIGSDDRSYARIATVANDGSQFQVWGYGLDAYWRPSLSP